MSRKASSASPPAQLDWLQALRRPDAVLSWTLPQWERVVRLARRLRLLGQLAETLAANELLQSVPTQARRHLIAEQRVSRWRVRAIAWTAERVTAMLGETSYPRVLLKGASYVAQGLPIALGRLPSDLDVMVPRSHVADALTRLEAGGWKQVELDEHDQRYYFEWSHEVPPLLHPLHEVELDLHHNILPPVARTTTNADALLARSQSCDWAGWKVLDPVDQVLHCAAHLFLDPDARERMRDLVDLDGMFRHFGGTPGFWAALPERSFALNLTEPLALACHFATAWLGTPVPEEAAEAISDAARRDRFQPLLRAFLHQVLMPVEPDQDPGFGQRVSALLLLSRYHRNRMPLRYLVPHLWHKLFVAGRFTDRTDEAATEN